MAADQLADLQAKIQTAQNQWEATTSERDKTLAAVANAKDRLSDLEQQTEAAAKSLAGLQEQFGATAKNFLPPCNNKTPGFRNARRPASQDTDRAKPMGSHDKRARQDAGGRRQRQRPPKRSGTADRSRRQEPRRSAGTIRRDGKESCRPATTRHRGFRNARRPASQDTDRAKPMGSRDKRARQDAGGRRQRQGPIPKRSGTADRRRRQEPRRSARTIRRDGKEPCRPATTRHRGIRNARRPASQDTDRAKPMGSRDKRARQDAGGRRQRQRPPKRSGRTADRRRRQERRQSAEPIRRGDKESRRPAPNNIPRLSQHSPTCKPSCKRLHKRTPPKAAPLAISIRHGQPRPASECSSATGSIS